MFEVGKLYKDVSGNTWEVLGFSHNGDFDAIGRRPDGRGFRLTFSPSGVCCGVEEHNLLVVEPETSNESGLVKSSGGPTTYYDYDPSWVTHNDYLEAKASQWGVHSWHLSNISKVLTRWGCKDGASLSYDAKKGLYSFCRIFAVIAGKGALRKYLQELLDDPQFKG
jgi:hypothetical protein